TVGRNGNLASVHLDVTMAHELAGGRARIGKAQVINHVVEARLQDLQHLFAGDAAALERAFVNAPELAFEQTVIITQLLFFVQAHPVVGDFASGLGAVHAGRIIAAFEIFGRPKNGQAEAAADANAGTSVASHVLNSRFQICDL